MTTSSVQVRQRPSAGAAPARRESENQSRLRKGPARWVVLVLVGLLAAVMMVPFVILVLNAFKSPEEYATQGPLSWPQGFYLDGLKNFWVTSNYPEKLMNSIVISTAVALFASVISLLNAYALGIGRVKGRRWILGLFLVANMIPHESLLYPLYFMSKAVHLYNTQLSVVIILVAINIAFGTYLLASTFSEFPKEILEAAALDGAGRWRVLWNVVYPLSRPTLSVLAIFFFIWAWNEFYIPLIMLITNKTQTIPVALATLQGDRHIDIPTINAGSLISLLPAVIFFLVFQRTLTRGIAAGSVK